MMYMYEQLQHFSIIVVITVLIFLLSRNLHVPSWAFAPTTTTTSTYYTTRSGRTIVGLVDEQSVDYKRIPKRSNVRHTVTIPRKRNNDSDVKLQKTTSNNDDEQVENTRKRQKEQQQWITCSSTKELTHAIRHLLQKGDRVAELGSQLREVSTAICESISYNGPNSHNDDRNQGKNGASSNIDETTTTRKQGIAVLVDTVRKFPKQQEKKSQNKKRDGNDSSRTKAMRRGGDELKFFTNRASFYEIERLDDWRKVFFPVPSTKNKNHNDDDDNLSLQQSTPPHSNDNIPTSYDVFVLDVSSIVGNDLEWTTLSIIREFLALNDRGSNNNNSSCRLVLVKSVSLNQWATRLHHVQRWIRQEEGVGLSLSPRISTTTTTTMTTEATNNHNQFSNVWTNIVATVGVQEYRDTIPYTVRSGDAVLEIGCHLGTSTSMLHSAASAAFDKSPPKSILLENATTTATNGNNSVHKITAGNGYCIGVDIGNKIVKGAQKRNSDIFFSVGDAWRTAALLRTQQDFFHKLASSDKRHNNSVLYYNSRVGFDVVYVDVGGLSGQDGLIESMALVSALSNALEPRCIVIKSLCMRRLSSLLKPYWRLQKLQ